jgi:hypothetical protein
MKRQLTLGRRNELQLSDAERTPKLFAERRHRGWDADIR